MSSFEQYIVKGGKSLKLGYTTGSCAAAATAAAAEMLLTDNIVSQVRLITPSGTELILEIEKITKNKNSVSCAVKKYSGDDPDITNGIYIFSEVSKTESDIIVTGGEGVGTVTEKGLSCKVGKPAINPVPMKMIKSEIEKIIKKTSYSQGLKAVISAPKGKVLAKKTYNSRLGIIGGISILGTTGIVEPMSNKAIIDTFKLEMDSAKARGNNALLLVPGNYGRDFAYNTFGIDVKKAIQYSNFVGEALDYASYIGIERIAIVGHCGKLVKLAAGIMNTHSNTADGRMEIIATHAGLAVDMTKEKTRQIFECNTVERANDILKSWNILEQVWESISLSIQYRLSNRLSENTKFAFAVMGKDGILASYGELEKTFNMLGGQIA